MRTALVGALLIFGGVGCAQHAAKPAASEQQAATHRSSKARQAAAKDQAQQAVAPDNTAINEREQQGAMPTPLDQGESSSDLAVTQHIREAVVADDSLSFEAKNVKIITQKGNVTLRGPVKSKQESDTIERAATKVAGPEHVTNQLDVEP